VMNNIIKCHDCGAREGEYHQPGCDMETCPFCCGQLISCDCPYNLLGIDASAATSNFSIDCDISISTMDGEPQLDYMHIYHVEGEVNSKVLDLLLLTVND